MQHGYESLLAPDSSWQDGVFRFDFKQALGLSPGESVSDPESERKQLLRYVNLQLLANGFPAALSADDKPFAELAKGLLENFQEKNRLLARHRSPVDVRIETFLRQYFRDVPGGDSLQLPARTLILDRHGMARELSLPAEADEYSSKLVQSFRVKNGVLHNPKHDRRTTKGTFHIAEGGLPIPGDKASVPRQTYVELFRLAVTPPEDLLAFPFTAGRTPAARGWVSLLIRPLVCPAVPGFCSEKRMEVRFFAPGSLVSNLDFVESIFGNAGDPFVPENDAGLDVVHWTGHTGAVILAPHLVSLTKKELGLPHFDEASERQRRDRMCWRGEDERYNDGDAFKITCRTEAGVIVTLIADNYFGYCKKEVKTQIGYAANLLGNVEEEHAGGTLAFPSFNLGEEFQVNSIRYNGRTFHDVARDYAEFVRVEPEGYGVDRNFPDLFYIPEDARASLPKQCIRWQRDGVEHSIPLLPEKVYMAPSGYQLRMEKHPAAPSWRLIGSAGEGALCHKPCTVSGGGKSEISKSIRDYMHYGPVFVSDVAKDLELVRFIMEKDYSTRWRRPSSGEPPAERTSRKLLDPNRSLGSVIKLLTPSPIYCDEYNAWLASIPNHIYAIVFVIKRFYRAEWGADWRRHFGVDIVNGTPGHELKYRHRQLVGTYLRVGLLPPSDWRTYKVRQDFAAAVKLQTEDDISASVVVPGRLLPNLGGADWATSYKFVSNCEYRLFQRPDDAVHRGLDKQTESDLSRGGNFLSNFEPLSQAQLREMASKPIDFDAFSPPMQTLLRSALDSDSSYVVCSANPRLVDGKPSKNPRYLQTRPDLVEPMAAYVAEMGTRLFRALPAEEAVRHPVNAVLLGRRNNPPRRDQGIRSLAVYNPIHYQELPELFMDFICSLTGKSPSTTGAGSEGALTKGPFNALRAAADLNAALVSYILTGLQGFSTSAGHIGPNMRVDHDISLLIPEVWCRMTSQERDPNYLRREGLLEPLNDFECDGKLIPASRLGYRITYEFVRRFFGRVFDNPGKIFDESMLQPEMQDRDSFADGILYIAEAHERTARQYYGDGTFEELCPPLQALLAIMAEGHWKGRTVHDPALRSMFTLDALLSSDWYAQRLQAQQDREVSLCKRRLNYLDEYGQLPGHAEDAERLHIAERRDYVANELARVERPDYLDELQGTLGAQPIAALTRRHRPKQASSHEGADSSPDDDGRRATVARQPAG